jgi:hypothetical protein
MASRPRCASYERASSPLPPPAPGRTLSRGSPARRSRRATRPRSTQQEEATARAVGLERCERPRGYRLPDQERHGGAEREIWARQRGRQMRRATNLNSAETKATSSAGVTAGTGVNQSPASSVSGSLESLSGLPQFDALAASSTSGRFCRIHLRYWPWFRAPLPSAIGTHSGP